MSRSKTAEELRAAQAEETAQATRAMHDDQHPKKVAARKKSRQTLGELRKIKKR